MQDIDISVQGEGRPPISLIRVKQDATTEELAVAAVVQAAHHAADGHERLVPLEEADEPLTTAGIGRRSRVHLRRCRKIRDEAIARLVEEKLADFSASED